MTSLCRRLLLRQAFSESHHFSWDINPANTMAYDTMLPPPPPRRRQAATAAATADQNWKPNKIETRDIDTQAYYAVLQLCVGC